MNKCGICNLEPVMFKLEKGIEVCMNCYEYVKSERAILIRNKIERIANKVFRW